MSEIQEEVPREQLDFLDERKKYYMSQGANEVGATLQAGIDWKTEEDRMNKTNDEAWDKFASKVGLAEIVEDQVRRALGSYKTAFHKQHKDKTVDFKLHYKTKKSEGGTIAEAHLILEIKRNGLWKVWRDKTISFQHIREMRQGDKWKLALMESLLQDLISWGITFCMQIDEIQDNSRNARVVSETNKGTVTDPGLIEAVESTESTITDGDLPKAAMTDAELLPTIEQ